MRWPAACQAKGCVSLQPARRKDASANLIGTRRDVCSLGRDDIEWSQSGVALLFIPSDAVIRQLA